METVVQNTLCNMLLVEDNPGDVHLIREAVRASDLQVTLHVVRDGQQALDFLQHKPPFENAPRPDAIMLDLNLPQRSGHQVLESIKHDPDLLRIPVIILTSSSAEDDVLKAYNHHANCYIVKPGDYTGFVLMIQRLRDFWQQTVVLPDGLH